MEDRLEIAPTLLAKNWPVNVFGQAQIKLLVPLNHCINGEIAFDALAPRMAQLAPARFVGQEFA